jgi:phosphate transport system protein
MPSDHVVKSFDDELGQFHSLVARMGDMAKVQLNEAVRAVSERDSGIATLVIDKDAAVDDLQSQIEDLSVRVLALRQPVAVDLRAILAAVRISAELERIADYAANVAKRAITLNQIALVRPAHAIPRMGRTVRQMVDQVLEAYAEGDIAKAVRVWNRDEEVDEMYSSLFRELLTYMMEDTHFISGSTHLLFIAKNLERIGDHATNIAETVHFLVTGTRLREIRPKSDLSSFTVVQPADTERKRPTHQQ